MAKDIIENSEKKFSVLSLQTFGNSVAENEKDTLKDYFVKTSNYFNLKNDIGKKIFYVGHRGSGKSALFNYISYEANLDKKNIVFTVTPDDFSYEIYQRVEHQCYDMKSIYGAVWHYTIIALIMKGILDYSRSQKINPRLEKDLEAIKIYLMENELIDNDTSFIFFKFFNKFSISKKFIKVDSIFAKDATRKEDLKLIKLLELHDIQKALNAFRRFLNIYSIFIFIDELDTGWDDSKEAHNFIYGLFYAVNKLKQESNLHIYLSLRQDMYNNLSYIFSDAEKIIDEIEIISWDKKTLKSMIGNRILNFVPTNLSLSLTPSQAIDCFFENDVLDYVIEHTLYRPREVIEFCNHCLERYKKNITLDIEYSEKVNMKIVKTVESNFSHHRLNGICEEYKFQFNHIKHLVYSFENKGVYYEYKDFCALIFESMFEISENHKDCVWVHNYIDNIDSMVKNLYDIGLIKIYSPSYDRYFAYYEMPFYSTSNVERLKIHDLFHAALKLK